MTDPSVWSSDRRAQYDAIVEANPSAAEATSSMVEFELARDLSVPKFYVSTAISSGGHIRDPDLPSGYEGRAEAIHRNNRTGALIMRDVACRANSVVNARNAMVPTELGHVKRWGDTDYLQFYFGWMGGLTSAGANWFGGELSDGEYTNVFARANDRNLPNEERWPAYRVFTEVAIAKLQQARQSPQYFRGTSCGVLVQIVDVGLSLGCRAEALFAEAEGLDVIAPAFGPALNLDLEAELESLQSVNATVGTPRQPIDLVPLSLRTKR